MSAIPLLNMLKAISVAGDVVEISMADLPE